MIVTVETNESESSSVKNRPLPNNEVPVPVSVVNGPAECYQDLPKLKDVITYRTSDSNEWKTGSVISRGGKVGGKHWHFLNIKSSDGAGDPSFVSFRDEAREWKKVENNVCVGNSSDHNEISEFVYIGKHASSDKFVDAKQEEIEKWKQMNVFEEIDRESCDESLISTRWVCTEKIKGGRLVCKARLVARGFEEDQTQLTKNSPTCTKDSFRLLLSVLSSKSWKIHSLDIKSAFLQGKPLNRTVYLKPPKEANTSKAWKLKQAVYGLSDAGRHWYDRVKIEFLKLGLTVSKLDKAVFIYIKDGVCQGIIIAHVDDFLFGGSLIFHSEIVLKSNRYLLLV